VEIGEWPENMILYVRMGNALESEAGQGRKDSPRIKSLPLTVAAHLGCSPMLNRASHQVDLPDNGCHRKEASRLIFIHNCCLHITLLMQTGDLGSSSQLAFPGNLLPSPFNLHYIFSLIAPYSPSRTCLAIPHRQANCILHHTSHLISLTETLSIPRLLPTLS